MDVNSERKTILVVHNDLGVRKYASEVLEYSGYNVLQVPDGTTALGLLQNNDHIDLLLTGIVIPEIDSIELARRACQKNPRLKVLFASGGFREDHLKPMDRFLRMPFRPQQLANAIADALANSVGSNIVALTASAQTVKTAIVRLLINGD